MTQIKRLCDPCFATLLRFAPLSATHLLLAQATGMASVAGFALLKMAPALRYNRARPHTAQDHPHE